MSTTERPVDVALKTMLVNNEPFQYAHLIKFERPSRPDALSGLVSTAAQRYTYLTDASINVSFDDGSTNLSGAPNGTQTYLSNKVLSIGSIQEQIKATSSTTSLVLDGTGLGAYIKADVTITGSGPWDISISAPYTINDFLAAGFREGDKVAITIPNNTTVKLNINSFRANNVIRVTKVDDDLISGPVTGCEFSLASEEVISILLDKNSTEYSSFINREVYIYRAYFTDGVMVGSPTCIFKGIINGVSFEDSEPSIKVTWSLASHWADFGQVKGRLTSDSSHRALDSNGVPQVNSALKPIYAYDKGFIHAETSIKLLAKYSVQVQGTPDVESKKGFLGIGASVKVKQNLVKEDRFTNLDFQIQAKAIPVIYGVRKAEGIPIFADTDKSNSNEVYAAVALSEGEIGGIYDVYIDGNSLICNDKADYDARNTSTDKVELVCRGNSSNGDVLQGQRPNTILQPFYTTSGERISIRDETIANNPYAWIARLISGTLSGNSTTNSYGLIDGDILQLDSPQNITLEVFTGKTGQKASTQLATKAFNKEFKIQTSYWTGSDTYEYWGPNHRLLDTAYVVGKFIIDADKTTIPEINFIVRGKLINCYNYDYSFMHDDKQGSLIVSSITTTSTTITITLPSGHGLVTGNYISLTQCNNPQLNFINKQITVSGNTATLPNPNQFIYNGSATYGLINKEFADNFLLGDTVTFSTVGGAQILTTIGTTTTQIIDKWTFYNPDGTQNVRFRFDNPPDLNYDTVTGNPSITQFQMKKGTNTWTMVSHNFNRLQGSVGGAIVSAVSGTSSVSNNLSISFAQNTDMQIEADPDNVTPAFQMVYKKADNTYDSITGISTFNSAIMQGSTTIATANPMVLATYYPDTYKASADAALAKYPSNLFLASKNTVKLSSLTSGISATSNAYTGDVIEITRYNSSTGKSLVQSGVIVGYDGATKIVTIDSIWDFIPVSTDTFRIYPKYSDYRVSINPAIQTLDYITSKTYGKALDPYKDLSLPSWLETARKCDTRSDVTVLTSAGSCSVGDIYRYTNTAGNIIWQGTVASIDSGYVTFTDVLGKLTNKWNSWKKFNEKEVLYNSSGELFYVTTAGVFSGNEPLSTTTTTGLSNLPSLSLVKFSGSGTDLTVNIASGNPVQSIQDGQKISGYSLYDCDDINYWKVSGWDEHAQRYATKNQCNISIDTSVPLFDNINGLLEHFNGILRYTAGRYYLDLEELDSYETVSTKPTSGNYVGRSILLSSDNRKWRYNESAAWELDIRTITTDDIIGKIQLSDEGTRSAFNSLTAAFADPANKFEARNVSFFNSDYLKADRNVPKKGNLSVPGITNYYNTRLLANSFLNKSRYGLSISMTLRPLGFLLLAGSIIQVIYDRYDWSAPGKRFRIESVTYQPDGLVDIVAKEYDDKFYSLSKVKKVAGTGATVVPGVVIYPDSGSPSNLTATTDQYNSIILTWECASTTGISNIFTEVWRSDTNNLDNATLIALVPLKSGTNRYVDTIAPVAGGVSSIDKYYWVRYRISQ